MSSVSSSQQFMFMSFFLLLRLSQNSVLAFSTKHVRVNTANIDVTRSSIHTSISNIGRSRRKTSHHQHIPHYASAIGSSSWDDENSNSSNKNKNNNNDNSKTKNLDNGVDQVFNTVDIDGSDSIDMDEYCNHLQPIGYTVDAITKSFQEMDVNRNGEISRQEFRNAMIHQAVADDDCPRGYFLNSVQKACQPLGPIGRISQSLETMGPFKQIYHRITNLFGIDSKKISKLGVSFALSYSIISNLNGAISFTVAWYISCKRTGLSPLVPGQWKNLLSSYAMIYGIIQLLRPFRVAAAIAMSKLSAEYLEMIETKMNCSRRVAIACQYLMGQLMMGVCAILGVVLVRMITGVPILGPT